MMSTQGSSANMAFVKDPHNVFGAIDPDRGYALVRIFRDVPQDKAWFEFVFEGVHFQARAKYSVSREEQKFTYVFDVSQLESFFRCGTSHRTARYNPTREEFRAVVLPALRDAVVAHVTRRPGRDSNVEIRFVEYEGDNESKAF